MKRAESPRRWRRWPVAVAMGVVAAGLTIAGVIAVGNAARDSLGRHDRYLLAFRDIECDAPPGQDRTAFLDEVQYYGQLPDKVNVLDPTLPDRLRAAFERHGRVQRVTRVHVLAPRRVQVELVFRP